MSAPHSDRAYAHPVPEAAPTAFSGAWIGRAPIGSLETPQDLCPGFDQLHEAERAWASEHAPRRVREFIAGRWALRTALRAAGWEGSEPLLPSDQGRPGLPDGYTGSITHKDGQALAIARRSPHGRTLGIDSEVIGPRERIAIARKVLTERELARWQAAPSWPTLLQSFSLKEAIYKALHPHVPRYIGFTEAEIDPHGAITMTLAHGEGPFALQGWWWWEGPESPSRRLITICEVGPG